MLDAQNFDFLGQYPVDHDIAFVRHQLVGATLAASATDVRMGSERNHLVLDEVNHFPGAGWAVLGDMLADPDQVVYGLFFPVDDVHALPLWQLDRGAHLAHRLLMRDGRPGVINGLLHFGLEPFRIGGRRVRVLHGGGAIRALGGCDAVRVVVHGVHVEAWDADPFQVLDQRFKLAEYAHLVAALRRQGALGHAVFDQDAPATVLADHVRAAHDAGLDQLDKDSVVNRFGRHAFPPLVRNVQ